MSEPILIALVQLFSIAAASCHKQLSDHTRSIIKAFLKQYLNTHELEEYLLLYDELFSFHNLLEDSFQWESEETLSKLREIADRAGKNLQQKDKVVVLIKFIEFVEEIAIDADQNTTDEKYNRPYYNVLKDSFTIDENDFKDICWFLLNHQNKLYFANSLFVYSKEDAVNRTAKYIIRDHLNGEIVILYVHSVKLIVGKYYGTDDLYLNGHYVSNSQAFTIAAGAILKGQNVRPIYYTDIVSKLLYIEQNEKIELIADNLSFQFKNSENGIQPFSMAAETGELIAVIGGSGAGKSTLLNLFNGSIYPKAGKVYLNGHSVHDENQELKKIIGYIPQDDLLIEELTVFQNLYFNARLCYRDLSSFKLSRIVLKILKDVDLLHIRDLVVGNPLKKVISGGQRKRLNIALELVREPFVLFADEPTSGLSSLDSEMVMLLLKEQTLKGKLVMVNIHQPSTDIFKLFDKLLFLDKGGFPIYYGNPIDSISYFKSASNHVNPTESECLSCGYVNPEQLFQITEAKTINKNGVVSSQRSHSPKDWYNLFKVKLQPKLIKPVEKSPLPENRFRIPNILDQFKIFSIRNFLIKITNKQYVLLNLIEAPLLALILAFLTRYSTGKVYMFGENKNMVAYLFMSVVVALFLGMMVSAEEIIKDRKIMKREAFLNLSRISYLNSKIVFLIALSAIQALLYVLVGNFILEIHNMLFAYWLVLFSVSCFANMVGLNISSALNSVVNIYILIPFILVPQILLSGVIVPFDNLNKSIASKKEVPVIGDVMASRWAFEALAVTQFTKNAYSKHFYTYDAKISNFTFLTGYRIPAIKSLVDDCHRNIAIDHKLEKAERQLAVIKDELAILEDMTNIRKDSLLQHLDTAQFTEAMRLQLNNYLKTFSSYFAKKQRIISAGRDECYTSLAQEIGESQVLLLKHKHFNASLSDWVLNKRADKKYVLSYAGFIRKKDPAYFEPTSKIGRAHFYAPIKRLGNIKIDTFWFNVGVLWLMSFLLYLTLWHDSFRKMMEAISYGSKKLKKN